MIIATILFALIGASIGYFYGRSAPHWERTENPRPHQLADDWYWTATGPNGRKIMLTEEAVVVAEARAQRFE